MKIRVNEGMAKAVKTAEGSENESLFSDDAMIPANGLRLENAQNKLSENFLLPYRGDEKHIHT